jgi:hypothetical protein
MLHEAQRQSFDIKRNGITFRISGCTEIHKPLAPIIAQIFRPKDVLPISYDKAILILRDDARVWDSIDGRYFVPGRIIKVELPSGNTFFARTTHGVVLATTHSAFRGLTDEWPSQKDSVEEGKSATLQPKLQSLSRPQKPSWLQKPEWLINKPGKSSNVWHKRIAEMRSILNRDYDAESQH